MIVISADTHKRTHALDAVDRGTGRIRGQREINADRPRQLARSAGRGAWTRIGYGRSRVAGW
jgi:hypothetical protein